MLQPRQDRVRMLVEVILISTIEGTASFTARNTPRQTVRMCLGMRCRMNVAEVMMPSQPSF